jgi:uncharacterized membrane protein YtjA (UPF0391 family)
MNLVRTVHDGAALVPAQLGGDLIGLAIAFLIPAIVAAIAGDSGIAGLSVTIATWLVVVFLFLAIASFVL